MVNSYATPSVTESRSVNLFGTGSFSDGGGEGGSAGGSIDLGSVTANYASSGQWAWFFYGNAIKVLNTESMNPQASYKFLERNYGDNVGILCVSEVVIQETHLLVIGIQSGEGDGYICIFDPESSAVLRCIEIPYVPSYIYPIAFESNAEDEASKAVDPISNPVAVGCNGCHILILDISFDILKESKSSTSVFSSISLNDFDGSANSATEGMHLYIELGFDSHTDGYFAHVPQGEGQPHYHFEDSVTVTSMLYMQELGTLAVGFNFGCFQLWSLRKLQLVYSSPMCDNIDDTDLPSVSHFAFQIPQDDPVYCYLWVGRSGISNPLSSKGLLSTVTMYELEFIVNENMNSDESFSAVQYVSFKKCTDRFFHRFMKPSMNKSLYGNNFQSRIVNIQVAGTEKENYLVPSEEGKTAQSLEEQTRIAFVWEISFRGEKSYFLAFFDLSKWYSNQQPSGLDSDINSPLEEGCTYFAIYLVGNMDASGGHLSDVFLDSTSIHSFAFDNVVEENEDSNLDLESLCFRDSFSFNISCLSSTSVTELKYLSPPDNVLQMLSLSGPAIFEDPDQAFLAAQSAGLISKGIKEERSGRADKRLMLFSVCFENGLSSLVSDYVLLQRLTGDGCVEFEYEPRAVMEWAWATFNRVKGKSNSVCAKLFGLEPCSYIADPHTKRKNLNLLSNVFARLGWLCSVFEALMSRKVTDEGLAELESRLESVLAVSQHLEIVIWFVRNGFLPEKRADEEGSSKTFKFPAEELKGKYASFRENRRRLGLQSEALFSELCSVNMNYGNDNELFIDRCLRLLGRNVQSVYDESSYPPNSIKELLDIFFVGTADSVEAKRSVIFYCLFDLMENFVSEEKRGSLIGSFSKTFMFSESDQKHIYGFWMLDNLCSGSIDYLLLPPVERSLQMPIMRALQDSGQKEDALKYVRSVESSVTKLEDILVCLKVYLDSGCFLDAFEYQRKASKTSVGLNKAEAEVMMTLFLSYCEKMKQISFVLQLPLNKIEEQFLCAFLSSRGPPCFDILIMFYLQRGRYVEAIKAHEEMKAKGVGSNKDPEARNAIMESFKSLLPSIQRQMLTREFDKEISAVMAKRSKDKVRQSEPLSATTLVKSVRRKNMSRARVLAGVLGKVPKVGANQFSGESADDSFSMLDEPSEVKAFLGPPATPAGSRAGKMSVSATVASPSNGDDHSEDIEEEDSATGKPGLGSFSLLSQFNQASVQRHAPSTPKGLKGSDTNTPTSILKKQKTPSGTSKKAMFQLMPTTAPSRSSSSERKTSVISFNRTSEAGGEQPARVAVQKARLKTPPRRTRNRVSENEIVEAQSPKGKSPASRLAASENKGVNKLYPTAPSIDPATNTYVDFSANDYSSPSKKKIPGKGIGALSKKKTPLSKKASQGKGAQESRRSQNESPISFVSPVASRTGSTTTPVAAKSTRLGMTLRSGKKLGRRLP
eukprot:Nk52_evm28s234 gene=Nk52_evmTU28s234